MTREDRVKHWLEHNNAMNIFERSEWNQGVREICDARFSLQEWQPTSENINALPETLRRYIHDLETRCDPAGDVAQLSLTKDQNRSIIVMFSEAEEALKALERERNQWKQLALAKDSQYWHDQFCQEEDKNAQLKAELAESKQQGCNHGIRERDMECFQDAASVTRERDELRSNVEALRYWIPLVGSIDVQPLFDKINELFDPQPMTPVEPKDWAWALAELQAGRKVRWHRWALNVYLRLNGNIFECREHGCHGESPINFVPWCSMFTESGWLPYTEKK